MRTIYGIHGNDSVTFLDLIAAEKYLYEHYPEHMGTKEACIEACENMIWEDQLIYCEGCSDKTLRDERDDHWVKASCCDSWFCSRDCHG
jgi:hypothetical protein